MSFVGMIKKKIPDSTLIVTGVQRVTSYNYEYIQFTVN